MDGREYEGFLIFCGTFATRVAFPTRKVQVVKAELLAQIYLVPLRLGERLAIGVKKLRALKRGAWITK